MKTNKYKIELTPVDKFFFGGDMTFQVGNAKSDFNERFSSYIIKSSYYPQQTSLLGMLRFLILRNAGSEVFRDNKIVDENAAACLIGARSFAVNADGQENDFGKIKHLSHVRVQRDGKELEFAPLSDGMGRSDSCTTGMYNFKDVAVPDWDRYDAKTGLTVRLEGGVKLDNVFCEDRRIGISRNLTTGKTEDASLFKQISYRFNDKDGRYSFVFYAEVEEIDLTACNGQLVSLGGDNSQFVFKASLQTETVPAVESDGLAVCLLSPAFFPRQTVQDTASFAVTELMPFRFLTDNADHRPDASYHILNSKLKRSRRYELYAPGSVFFFKESRQRDAFIAGLEGRREFRQIGYNEYKSIQ